ncbi:MAG: hypothetical protein ABJH04_07365 [Cyclobacteriaceae bacterium]
MSNIRPSSTFIQIIKFQRWVVVLSLTLAVVSFLYSVYAIQTERKISSQKAYFITTTGSAVGSEIFIGDSNMKELELKNHVKIFANCMWTFDQYNFWDQVTKGVEISSGPGKRIYSTYKANNFFEDMRAYNAKSKVYIDKIEVLDAINEPYKVRLYARHSFQTEREDQIRNLIAYVELVGVSRSEDNVHGLLVSAFNIENNDLLSKAAN